MKKEFSLLVYAAVIFFIIKLILTDHRLQGKLLGLAAFVLVMLVIAVVINLVSRIFKQSK